MILFGFISAVFDGGLCKLFSGINEGTGHRKVIREDGKLSTCKQEIIRAFSAKPLEE